MPTSEQKKINIVIRRCDFSHVRYNFDADFNNAEKK